MSTEDEWDAGIIYIRYSTDCLGHILEHRCWKCTRFLAARQAEVDKANAQRKPGEPLMRIDVVTDKEFLAEKNPRQATQ